MRCIRGERRILKHANIGQNTFVVKHGQEEIGMIKNWCQAKKPEKDEIAERLAEAREKLAILHLQVKEKKIPVMIVLEGWGASGKGSAVGKIIHNMDPRFYRVETLSKPSEEELRRPFLYRYFKRIPEAGRFSIYDGGWLDEISREYVSEKSDMKDYRERIESVRKFERTLTDNGYLLMKFFFHIGKDEQKKRFDELLSSKDTEWRVSKDDLWQNKHYDEYLSFYDTYMYDTNQPNAPWYIIDAENRKWAQLQLLEAINQGIETALMNNGYAAPILQNVYPIDQIPDLADISLDLTLTDEEYREELDKCQARLGELHNILYRKKIPVVIAYEGWDAAGKGGNIRRIADALDPRGYEVNPIASPEPHEKSRHYLWRFWTRLPKDGHIGIFDRTWYGRVMVERLEGFCSENDWRRAYNEINEFEHELVEWGAIVVKFWVQIDKDTQLERFTLRQNTPEKQWKITDEDWRNREKWDMYEDAINEMLKKTNTSYAPWHILESNDKKYARIKALKTLIKAIEDRI